MPTTSNSNRPLLISLCLFTLLFIFTYPFYRYYIDPDAVAYITIAKRYAAGDYLRAINGLWSPFAPWLISFCIRCGMDALLASQFINGAACICIIGASYILFRHFQLDRLIVWSLMLCLPVFLIFCHYIQLFDDLWQVFFLLCYLLLVIAPSFINNKSKWVITGVIAALAYFAKAYSFYFIVLHLLVTLIILAKQNGLNRKAIIKPFATVLIVMLLLMSPWLYALHKKYNIWTLSTASSLNESWFLTGHKNPKPGIDYLIPPPYDNSPCNWEDPYLNEGHIYKPWEQSRFLLIQAFRSAVAFFQTFVALHQISLFLFVVLIWATWQILFKKNKKLFNVNHRILLWASLIMPLGYLALHMEARYIWLLAYTGMILGAVWLQQLKENKNPYFPIAAILFAISFTIYPVYKMSTMFRSGEDLYKQTIQLKQLKISGSFTANIKPNDPEVTTLITGMQYYEPRFAIWNIRILEEDKLLKDISKYHIKYCFFYIKEVFPWYKERFEKAFKPFPVIYRSADLIIYKTN